jgi:hypothetical protein
MTLTIEIPALDRLCAWLESRDKTDLLGVIENEIVQKIKEAAESGVPRPKFDAPSQEPQKAPQEPPKPEPTEKPTAAAAPAPATPAVTLDAVQRAAAQMRDDGKLKAVTDMFPEFGIKKLSDLKGDQLQKFGDRLREMGAKI